MSHLAVVVFFVLLAVAGYGVYRFTKPKKVPVAVVAPAPEAAAKAAEPVVPAKTEQK